MNSPFPHSAQSRLVNRRKAAFTLVELLAVLAVISVLATMITPAVSSIFSGKNSTRALDTLSNSAVAARQTAMSSGRPVALVVNRSDRSTPDETQAVLLLQAPAEDSQPWIAKGAWTKVPSNVEVAVFSRAGVTSFYDASSAGPLSGTLPVKYDGKEVTAYDYIVFYPDGSVDAPASGPALTFRRLNSSNPAVDYTLVVQSNSGRAKILQ